MPTSLSLTPSDALVKRLLGSVEQSIAKLVELALSGATARALELAVWSIVNDLGRQLLSIGFATLLAKVTADDLAVRGLTQSDVMVRSDGNYTMTLMTTFGRISVPTSAYRDFSGPLSVTRSPGARKVFPLYSKCRSSELCLEWESRLAGKHPFRTAEKMLSYFTHGEVHLEDTTIERHAVRVGHLIDQKWLYREPAQIKKLVAEQATRDASTNRPIVYWSSDAHSLRRFVNESCTPEWKMMNGVRVWCVNQRTGAIIHLGGEFTCGDAHYARERLASLLAAKILPANGDFGDGLVAQYVFVSDGMPWIEEHLASQLPTATVILDAYHLIERLGEYATEAAKFGQLNSRAWMAKVTAMMFGTPVRRATHRTRRGHRKAKRRPTLPLSPPPAKIKNSVNVLLGLIRTNPDTPARQALLGYVTANRHRMDYLRYRAHGYQIGSGAMESFHRTGSQERLKRPGAKWLPETLEAMFRLRMLEMVERWNEWWSQENFFQTHADRFIHTTYRTKTGPEASKPAPKPAQACAAT